VANAEQGVFLVVDGVGGQAGGEEASDIIARVLPDWVGRTAACGWRDRDLIEAAVEDAVEATRREMAELAERDVRYCRMGATFALAVVVDGALYVTHVGDCRAYLWHRGTLRRLTKDQTFVQAAMDGGLLTPEEAATHRWRHVVTNTVGIQPLEELAAISEWHVSPNDRLLLCSDGLTDVVSDPELSELMSLNCGPQLLAEAAVELALEYDSRDNVTCVAVDFIPDSRTGDRGISGRAWARKRANSPASPVRSALPTWPLNPKVATESAWYHHGP